MRILEILTPSRLGGAEKYVGWISKEFRAMGHEVLVGIRECPQVEAFYQSLNVDVEVIKIAGKLNPFAHGRVKAFARNFRADIVHTHLSTGSKWGLSAAKSIGIPGIGHVHSFNSMQPYRDALKIIAVSNAVKEHILRNGFASEKVDVVHPSSKIDISEPPYDIQRFDGLTICCASRIRQDKGVEVLFRAFELVHARIPNTRLLFCGDGPLLWKLQSRAATQSLPVSFLGFRPDVAGILAASDVAVQPSIAREGFGLSILEAQAVGTPVVASNVGGVSEAMVPGRTGLLVEPADPYQLAEALITLLTEEGTRMRMSQEARAFASQRTIERSAAELLAVCARME